MPHPQTVLSVHNFYRHPGGEDCVFADEAVLLEQHGHTVVRYVEHNRRIAGAGIAAAGSAVWSNRSFRRLRSALRAQACDVAHFHNTFPLISPAGYYAASAANVPVVQTLHNYRLICPAGTLLRNGAVCEKCIGRAPLPAVVHGCYRVSRPATAETPARRTPSIMPRNSWVRINVSDCTRSCVINIHRQQRCSTEWKWLHAADCAT